MDDFGFVLSVAFSGADLTRALWLGLVGSLFCTKQFGPARMAILLLLIDRVWPFVGMGLAGYEMPQISQSVAYAVQSIPRDLTIHFVRFVGLFALAGIGYQLRIAIHRGSAGKNGLPVPY